LTTNDVLEVLDVAGNVFTDNGATQFFDLLPQMKGLKAVYGLSNGLIGGITDGVGLALVGGLRKNTKLQKIFKDQECGFNVRSFDSYFYRDLEARVL
jgi:hypothetical protein